MGGEGSGNSGKKKIGNKYYHYTGSHKTGMKAARSANQYEGIGIPTKIKKEKREPAWGGEPVMGYSVYTHASRKRSARERRYDQMHPHGSGSRGRGTR